MDMKKQALLLGVSGLMMLLPSLAQANESGWYVRGNVGYGVVTDTNFTGDLLGDVEGEANLAESLGLGYQLGNNWRIELDGSQLWNDTGAITQAGNTSSDMRLTSGMVNAIYDFSGLGNWEPYLGAGIGLSKAKLSAQTHSFPSGRLFRNGGAPINSIACPNWNSCTISDSDTAFAYQLMAGLGYKLSDNLTWDTHYRYMSVGDLKFKGTGANLANPVTAGVFGAGSPIDTTATGVGSHTLMTGLRYRFGGATPPPPPPPPPPPEPARDYQCWNGDMVVSASDCPAEPPKMKTCWDNSSIPVTEDCPAPPPPPPPPPPPAPRQQSYCDTGASSFVVYFPWDKAYLTDQAKAVIQNAVDMARQCNITDVNIAGYTDTSGSKAYNLRLSKRRADNVEKALKADGLTATHITKEAKGEEGLAIPTADGVREPLNRRAEVVIRLVPSDSFIQ